MPGADMFDLNAWSEPRVCNALFVAARRDAGAWRQLTGNHPVSMVDLLIMAIFVCVIQKVVRLFEIVNIVVSAVEPQFFLLHLFFDLI